MTPGSSGRVCSCAVCGSSVTRHDAENLDSWWCPSCRMWRTAVEKPSERIKPCPTRDAEKANTSGGLATAMAQAHDFSDQGTPRSHTRSATSTPNAEPGHSPSSSSSGSSGRGLSPDEPILDALTTEEVAADLGVVLPGRALSPEALLAAEYHSDEPCDCYPPNADHPVIECEKWAMNILIALNKGGYVVVPERLL